MVLFLWIFYHITSSHLPSSLPLLPFAFLLPFNFTNFQLLSSSPLVLSFYRLPFSSSPLVLSFYRSIVSPSLLRPLAQSPSRSSLSPLPLLPQPAGQHTCLFIVPDIPFQVKYFNINQINAYRCFLVHIIKTIP